MPGNLAVEEGISGSNRLCGSGRTLWLGYLIHNPVVPFQGNWLYWGGWGTQSVCEEQLWKTHFVELCFLCQDIAFISLWATACKLRGCKKLWSSSYQTVMLIIPFLVFSHSRITLNFPTIGNYLYLRVTTYPNILNKSNTWTNPTWGVNLDSLKRFLKYL